MPVKTVGDVVKDTFDNTFFKNPLKVEWKTKSLHSNEQFSSGAWGSTHGEMSCTATVKCRSNGLKLPLLGLGTSQVSIILRHISHLKLKRQLLL